MLRFHAAGGPETQQRQCNSGLSSAPAPEATAAVNRSLTRPPSSAAASQKALSSASPAALRPPLPAVHGLGLMLAAVRADDTASPSLATGPAKVDMQLTASLRTRQRTCRPAKRPASPSARARSRTAVRWPTGIASATPGRNTVDSRLPGRGDNRRLAQGSPTVRTQAATRHRRRPGDEPCRRRQSGH